MSPAAKPEMKRASMDGMKKSEMLNRLFMKLLPVQVAIIAMGAVNSIVDGTVAGQFIDARTVGVVGLYVAMINVYQAVGNMLAGGTAVLCGRSMGRGDINKTSSIFSLTITVTVIAGLVLTAVSLIAPGPLASILGARGDLREPLILYIRGYAIGVLPLLLSQQVAAFLQLERQSAIGYAGIAGLIISNIALDVILVAVLHMGIWGLALATSISNWIYLLILLPYYFTGKAQLKYSVKNIGWSDLGPMVLIGFPGATLVLCLAFRAIVINRVLLTNAGEAGLSAQSAFGMISGLFIAYALGVGSTIRMLSSVFYGEGDRDSLFRLLRIGYTRMIPMSLIVTVAVMLLSTPISMLFFPDKTSEVFRLTRQLFLIYSLCIPLIVVAQIICNYLQATGHNKYVNILSIFDGFVFAVVPALILAPKMGALGVWLSNPIGIILTLLMSVCYAFVYWKRKPANRDEWMLLPPGFGVPDEDRLDLTIHGVEEVVTTATQVQSFCEAHDVEGKKSMYAALCLEEMADNIVEHGFTADNKKHNADVRVVYENGSILLRIKDDCRPFDPMERAAMLNNSEDPMDNIGLRMVLGLSDDVAYYNLMGLNVLSIRL